MNRKVLLDLGTHFGNGLASHVEKYKVDESWHIHTFEPNVFTFNELAKIRENKKDPHYRYRWIRWDNVKYHNAAVWVQDCPMEFYCSTAESTKELVGDERFDAYMKSVTDRTENGESITNIHEFVNPTDAGSTLIPPPLHNREGHDFIQQKLEFRDEHKTVVKAIDFSKWLLENFDDNDYIIVKMDIEGAEYSVLEKMILDKSISLINSISIEWHDWFLPNMTRNESLMRMYHSKNFILQSLTQLGVKIENWK